MSDFESGATEATLQELLKAVLTDGRSPTPAEVKMIDLINRTTDAYKKHKDGLEDLTKAQTEAIAEEQDRERQRAVMLADEQKHHASDKKIKQDAILVFKTMLETISGVTKLMTSMSGLGNSISGASKSLAMIPIIGTTLSTVLGATADATESVYKAFQEAATVGASFGNSITWMLQDATAAGLTFGQFTSLLVKHGKDLANLGGTTAQGVKKFSAISAEMKSSDLTTRLANLGYSAEDVNSALITHVSALTLSNNVKGMSDKQLAESTSNYLVNLDAVSRLTGESKQTIQARIDAQKGDSEVQAMMRGMTADQQTSMTSFLATLGDGQSGIKQMLAKGYTDTEEGMTGYHALSKTYAAAAEMQSTIREKIAKGLPIQNELLQLDAIKRNEAKAWIKQNDWAANQGSESQRKLWNSMNDAASGNRNYTVALDESLKAQNDKTAKDKVSAEQVSKLQQVISSVSNKFMEELTKPDMLAALQSTFEFLSAVITGTVLPAFNWMAENTTVVLGIIWTLGLAIGAFSLALTAVTAALTKVVLGALFSVALTAILSPIGIAVIAIGAAFGILAYFMNEAGWTFGMAIEGLCDNINWLWLKFKNFFGKTSEVDQNKFNVLAAREKERDAKRAKNREIAEKKEFDAAKKEEEAAKKHTTEVTKNADAISYATKKITDLASIEGNTIDTVKAVQNEAYNTSNTSNTATQPVQPISGKTGEKTGLTTTENHVRDRLAQTDPSIVAALEQARQVAHISLTSTGRTKQEQTDMYNKATPDGHGNRINAAGHIVAEPGKSHHDISDGKLSKAVDVEYSHESATALYKAGMYRPMPHRDKVHWEMQVPGSWKSLHNEPSAQEEKSRLSTIQQNRLASIQKQRVAQPIPANKQQSIIPSTVTAEQTQIEAVVPETLPKTTATNVSSVDNTSILCGIHDCLREIADYSKMQGYHLNTLVQNA